MGKHFDRAQILIEQNRYDLAEIELRKEIAENPDLDRGYGTLALCLINDRKLTSETLELINYALSLDAGNDWNHYLLAIYWYYRNDCDRAIVAIQIAINLNSNSYRYFYVLASALWQKGLRNYAICGGGYGLSYFGDRYFIRLFVKPVFSTITKSLTLNPNFLPARNLLTDFLFKTGRNQSAIDNINASLYLDPNNSFTYALQGYRFNNLGRYSEAIDSFKLSLRIDPNSDTARTGLLEAMRSQYWIYPLISVTSKLGKIIFLLSFPVFMAVTFTLRYFTTGSFDVKTFVEPYLFAMMVAFVSTSLFAQSTFNFLLYPRLSSKSILNTRELIAANYAILLTIYIPGILCLGMLFEVPTRMDVISMFGTIWGSLVSIFTFSYIRSKPSKKRYSVAYRLAVIILAIINLVIGIYHIKNPIMIYPGILLLFLVACSPFIAVANSHINEE